MHTLETENSRWVRCNYEIVLEDEQREYDVILPKVSVTKPNKQVRFYIKICSTQCLEYVSRKRVFQGVHW